jgi:hypothetical protein
MDVRGGVLPEAGYGNGADREIAAIIEVPEGVTSQSPSQFDVERFAAAR